jgi:lysophospholipase L1-like esterase
MTKYCKVALALTLFLFTAVMPVAAGAATAAPPKVVFIGDQFTYMWGATPSFAANKPNWINKGWAWTPIPGCFVTCGLGTSEATAARFQSDVVSQHPAIVHIMVGVDDLAMDDDAEMVIGIAPGFTTSLQQMVSMAKAANIKVILGIEPLQWADPDAIPPYPQQLNAIVAAYGAQNNIPVINYGDALCGCVGSLSAPAYGAGYDLPSPGGPTAAGYALMSQMAEVAILNTLGQTPTKGYLQNVELSNQPLNVAIPSSPLLTNVNTVGPGFQLQFTPFGQYSNGLVEPFVNSTYVGSSGTWASSNPLVMYVNQTGVAWALTPGKANITYIAPNGVKFNLWTMTVTSY